MDDTNSNNILIIEENSDTCKELSESLNKAGFQVNLLYATENTKINAESKNKADVIIASGSCKVMDKLKDDDDPIDIDQYIPVILLLDKQLKNIEGCYSEQNKIYACLNSDESISNIINTVKYALRWSRKHSMEHMYESIIDGMIEGVYIIDYNGNLVDVNQGAVRALRYDSKEEMLKAGLSAVDGNHNPDWIRHRASTMPVDQIQIFETSHETKDGEMIPMEIYSSIVRYMGKNYILSMSRDITDRKKMEKKIKNQLEEKEILIKAIHHRIKNNIASISALISLQMHRSESSVVKDALIKALGRIQCMQILYETLLQNYSLSSKHYLESLLNAIMDMYASDKKIRIKSNIEDIKFNEQMIFPLGVVFEEIVTNIMKYAFDERDKGNIDLSLTQKDDLATLVIKDDGIGLPDDYEGRQGFGIMIIKIMSEQLGGKYEIKSDKGTCSTLTFRL